MPEVLEKGKGSDEVKPEKAHKKLKGFPNKVVIRKLPPNLNADGFIEIISPLPDYSELFFIPADWSLGSEASSRAYIEFKHEEDIFIFKEKFDEYVFVDSVRGSEYPAIVEYASFQGLPKSRARKKDKNVGTIETEQHFISFLEQLKNEEENEGQKNEPKLEFSYQLKDDKKITSTPLIEFLSAKNQERRDNKRKRLDEKKKHRDDEKQHRKIQVAKNIPEAIREAKEDVVYDDGVTVRTVRNALSRNERRKEAKSESKQKPEESAEKEQERREKRDKDNADRDARRKAANKERDQRRKLERDQRKEQRIKEQEQKKASGDVDKAASVPVEAQKEQKKTKREDQFKEAPVKSETKRYSALRKARQDKAGDAKDSLAAAEGQEEASGGADNETQKTENPKGDKNTSLDDSTVPRESQRDQARKEARNKRNQERRAREADERAQRQIKNKDRPTLQLYQPKRRQDEARPDRDGNLKSSEETSEASRRKSDSDHRKERRDRKNSSRKNSRDETGRKKRYSHRNSEVGGADHEDDAKMSVAKADEVTEKLEKLALDPPKDLLAATETLKNDVQD